VFPSQAIWTSVPRMLSRWTAWLSYKLNELELSATAHFEVWR